MRNQRISRYETEKRKRKKKKTIRDIFVCKNQLNASLN